LNRIARVKYFASKRRPGEPQHAAQNGEERYTRGNLFDQIGAVIWVT